MSETVYGIHLLVFVTFVSIIGDIVKLFTKGFHDTKPKINNSTNKEKESLKKITDNSIELKETINTTVDTSEREKDTDNEDDKLTNRDEKILSDKNKEEHMTQDQDINPSFVKKMILFVIDNMLPHFILGSLYKKFNGFFKDQDKYLPPFLWIDFLPQRAEDTGISSLKRFITFSIARSGLVFIYSILYPLIYGSEYKPNVPKE